MLFFAHLRLRTESARRDTLTPEMVALEIQRIHELLADGAIHNAWKKKGRLAIIVLLKASTDEECRAIISTLPLFPTGMLEIEMITQVEPYVDVYPQPDSELD